mmetsp:Transcript_143648/g.400361  ORF Transcript_143648/g.400361 Transcript_143648/m.400361 type:complete len:318 (+) Transcript_143648:2022-2975(+)
MHWQLGLVFLAKWWRLWQVAKKCCAGHPTQRLCQTLGSHRTARKCPLSGRPHFHGPLELRPTSCSLLEQWNVAAQGTQVPPTLTASALRDITARSAVPSGCRLARFEAYCRWPSQHRILCNIRRRTTRVQQQLVGCPTTLWSCRPPEAAAEQGLCHRRHEPILLRCRPLLPPRGRHLPSCSLDSRFHAVPAVAAGCMQCSSRSPQKRPLSATNGLPVNGTYRPHAHSAAHNQDLLRTLQRLQRKGRALLHLKAGLIEVRLHECDRYRMHRTCPLGWPPDNTAPLCPVRPSRARSQEDHWRATVAVDDTPVAQQEAHG